MRLRLVSLVGLLACSLPAGAAPPSGPAGEQPAAGAAAGVAPAAAADGTLKLVVALIRHGVRAPLGHFAEHAGDHTPRTWPTMEEWNVRPFAGKREWGDLTEWGYGLVRILGESYASRYLTEWPGGFEVGLWADLDNRTIATADALSSGFLSGGVDHVSIGSNYALRATRKTDPLFHPFDAGCGNPDPGILGGIADSLKGNEPRWVETYGPQLARLYTVLGCDSAAGCHFEPTDKAVPCPAWTSDCNAPVKWTGRFSYASSASEAFLLEYANRMTPAWGLMPIPLSPEASWDLRDLIRLHEFYFDQTDRQPNLAQIQGSNLVREIHDQINRRAGGSTLGKCPRMSRESRFIGLVGHDTNLAAVGALLNLGWRFDDPALPPDTFGLPPNHALPASALVFELRQAPNSGPGQGYFLRIVHVTQGLLQMREGRSEVFRLRVQPADSRLGDPCKGSNPCEMSLDAFNEVARAVLAANPFLSTCAGEESVYQYQACGPPRPASP